jgi:hypothetical protein
LARANELLLVDGALPLRSAEHSTLYQVARDLGVDLARRGATVASWVRGVARGGAAPRRGARAEEGEEGKKGDEEGGAAA